MQRILLIILMLSVALPAAGVGTKRKRPRPHQYGTVTINNFASQAGMAPVEFDHWVHRARFTCRLCHVDLGFAMKTGETEVRALDNQRGLYCGSCHDGRRTFDGAKLFAACSDIPADATSARCGRCHLAEPSREKEDRFYRFKADLPRDRFSNGIDWEAAEREGKIRPSDYLEGVSVQRAPMAVKEDFRLDAKLEGMPEIIFSHQKHTVWNGCEVCHPEIFLGVRRGATSYTMIELFQGRYCGVCHDTVAFPQMECQRCHTQPVQ